VITCIRRGHTVALRRQTPGYAL